MKFEMSEKDRKLLVMLSIFVIVVCIGYWGIRPTIKGIVEINKDKEEALDLQAENEQKIAQLTMVQAENEQKEAQIQEYKGKYYKIMTSAEIDKYITGMILERNLNSYDLSITMPTGPDDTTKLAPYQYSGKAIGVEDKDMEEIDDVESQGDLTGVYTATVSLRIGGDEKQIRDFIDFLSESEKKLRICSYTWSGEKNLHETEDGAYTVDIEKILTMTVELYMCEE